VEIGQTLWHLVIDLGTLAVELLALALRWGAVLAWLAWWLWGVNWKKVWPVLAQGAWVPLLLLMVLAAMTWSRLDPVACNCLGFMTLPNFWWQFLAVSLLVGLTFLCGWLQGVFGWEPAEVDLEPPVASAHAAEHAHH
jgi:hypothetical protein